MDWSDYERWIWLGAILGAGLAADYLVVRGLLEVLRPASAWAFWAGRAGKLTAVAVSAYLFNTLWCSRFLEPTGRPAPQGVLLAEWALGIFLLLMAVTSIPRPPHRRRQVHE